MTRKTFLAWRSQSTPKEAPLPVLADAINCSSLHTRRSLTSEVSCTERNVVIATMDLLLQTRAAAAPRRPSLNLPPCPSTRGHTPDSSQTSSHLPRNPLETSLSRDLPASRLVSPKRCFGSPYQRAPSTPRPPPPSCAHLA